jgi:transcriptional regulator with XRE-family HTH domain
MGSSSAASTLSADRTAEEAGAEFRRGVGSRIRQARTMRGLSLNGLGGAAKTHLSQVVRFEKGARLPDVSTVVRLAKALEVSIDWILTGEDARTPSFRAHIDGSLVNVRLALRAAYNGTVVDVRADGRADARGSRAAVSEARAVLVRLGFTPAADGGEFVARGAAALRFWSEGMGSLPDSWELFVPDSLVGVAEHAVREPPDPVRVNAFAARFSTEPDIERAAAMLATREGQWFFTATFGHTQFVDAREQARYDTLLARMIERGSANARPPATPVASAEIVKHDELRLPSEAAFVLEIERRSSEGFRMSQRSGASGVFQQALMHRPSDGASAFLVWDDGVLP